MLAFSDALLALAGGFVMLQMLRGDSHDLWLRATVLFGAGLVAAAALVGTIRFSGWEAGADWHRLLSDMGAWWGIPLLAAAVAIQGIQNCPWLQMNWHRPLSVLLPLLVVALGWLNSRPLSAALAVGLLLLALILDWRRAALPLFILTALLGAGLVKEATLWPLTTGLILAHCLLALALLGVERAMRRPFAQGAAR